MNASIIIPTFNKLPRLKLTLTSLLNQSFRNENFEVIVIDDASKNETNEFINNLNTPFTLRYFKNTQQKGRAYSRNKGVEVAKYDILIFIDDDMLLSPNFIAEHVNSQKTKSQIIHGKIANMPYLRYFEDPTNIENTSFKKFNISQKNILYNFSKIIENGIKISPIEKLVHQMLSFYPGKMDWIAFNGGNISLPKSWFLNIGGFDENFGLNWGCEDIEIGYRLFKKKYLFIYSEKAINYHISHSRPNFINEHQKNINYFFDKHQDQLILMFHDFISNKLAKDEFINQAILLI